MNWNFDTIFFFGFGILCLYLGFSNSKWLFWGSSRFERGELSLGKHYKRIINMSGGLISLGLALYFLLK